MKLLIFDNVEEYYTTGYTLYESGLIALFKHSDSNLNYKQFKGYFNNITIFGK